MVPKRYTKENPPKIPFRMSTRHTARGNAESEDQDPPADTNPAPADESEEEPQSEEDEEDEEVDNEDSQETNKNKKKDGGKKKSASPKKTKPVSPKKKKPAAPKKKKDTSPKQPTRASSRLAAARPTPDVGPSSDEFRGRAQSIIASSAHQSPDQEQAEEQHESDDSDLENRVRNLQYQPPWRNAQPSAPSAAPAAESSEPTEQPGEQTGEKRRTRQSVREENIYDATSSEDDEEPPKKRPRKESDVSQSKKKPDDKAADKKKKVTFAPDTNDNAEETTAKQSKKKAPKKTQKKGKAKQPEVLEEVTGGAGGRIMQRYLTSSTRPQSRVPEHLRSQVPLPEVPSQGAAGGYQLALTPQAAVAAGFPPARASAPGPSNPACSIRTGQDGSAYILNADNPPQQQGQNLYFTEDQRRAAQGQQRQQPPPLPRAQQGREVAQFSGTNYTPLPSVTARASTRTSLFEALASNDPHRLALEQKKRADELSEVLLQRNRQMETQGFNVSLEAPRVELLLEDIEAIRQRLNEVQQQEQTLAYPQGIPSPEAGEVVQQPVQDQGSMQMDIDQNRGTPHDATQAILPAQLHIDPSLFGVVGPDPTPYQDLTAEQYRLLPRHQPPFPPGHRARVLHLPPLPQSGGAPAQQQQGNNGNNGGNNDVEMTGTNDWVPWQGMSDSQANQSFGQMTHPHLPEEVERYTYPPPVNDMVPGPDSMLGMWTSGPHWNIDQNRDLLQEMRDEEQANETPAAPAGQRSRPRKKAAPKKKATPKKK